MNYGKLTKIWHDHGVFDLLGRDYRTEIEAAFDWEAINAELDRGEFITNEFEIEEGWDDMAVSTLFLGTVFSLTPSGKYYMPWACSNVLVKEAVKDECWQEAFTVVLDEKGLFSMNGEGDPCDIFVCKHLDLPEEEEEEPDPEVAEAVIRFFWAVLCPLIGYDTLHARHIAAQILVPATILCDGNY